MFASIVFLVFFYPFLCLRVNFVQKNEGVHAIARPMPQGRNPGGRPYSGSFWVGL